MVTLWKQSLVHTSVAVNLVPLDQAVLLVVSSVVVADGAVVAEVVAAEVAEFHSRCPPAPPTDEPRTFGLLSRSIFSADSCDLIEEQERNNWYDSHNNTTHSQHRQ